MNFKLLFKAIGLVLLCLLGLAVVTFLGTLSFMQWPGTTTITIAVTLVLAAFVFFTHLAYYWLEDRPRKPIMVEVRTSGRKTLKQNI